MGGCCIYISYQLYVEKNVVHPSPSLEPVVIRQQVPLNNWYLNEPLHLFSSLPVMLNSNHEVPISCHLSGSKEKQKTLPRTFIYEEKGRGYIVSIISYNRRVSKCNSGGNDCICGECFHALVSIWGLCMNVNPRVCSWFWRNQSSSEACRCARTENKTLFIVWINHNN